MDFSASRVRRGQSPPYFHFPFPHFLQIMTSIAFPPATQGSTMAHATCRTMVPPSCLYEVSSFCLPSLFVDRQGVELWRWPYAEVGSQTNMSSHSSNRLTHPGGGVDRSQLCLGRWGRGRCCWGPLRLWLSRPCRTAAVGHGISRGRLSTSSLPDNAASAGVD